MSLDLYIKKKLPKKRLSSGIFVRENGKKRELTSINEIEKYFPDFDTSNVEIQEIEDDIAWRANITHNLGEMAKNVPCGKHSLYKILWRPDEEGIDKITEEYRDEIYNGLAYVQRNKRRLEKYNSSNGWGIYEDLLRFLRDLADFLSDWDGKEEMTLFAWR